MTTFCTVNWQNYQGRGTEYVNVLFDSVRRNLEAGSEGCFVVFTDDDLHNYAEGIETRPLPPGLEGWWNKLAAFVPNAFPDGERIVFLDLDTVITGPLDALAAYRGDFGILADFYRPHGLQSSVMAWEAGRQCGIWDSFVAAGCPQDDPGGDQSWIERCQVPGRERLQVALPDFFVSYKVSGGVIPARASVCVFHGHPRPHEVITGWVPRVWREGGLSNVELKSVCNTATEALLANVRAAAARDLPWFQPVDEHERHVAIIGGGPSLVDKIEEIQWRQSIGQDVWVLNNAHKALEGAGIRYDAQVLLDARPETVGFIAHQAAECFVASQCDSAVFDALRDQRVTLFHVNTPGMDFLAAEKERPAYLVGGGTTVGMNALALAFLLGYRQIHLYGFDSCYRDGAHHAYPQPLNDGEHASEALWDGKTYFCAPWMIGQAQEFMEVVPGYMADGAVVTVHGSGLLPDIGLGMLGTLSPAQQRAAEVLARAPPGACGVEVGVFAGQMSAALLRGNPALLLTMVDSWEGGGAAYEGDSGDWHAELRQESQDEFMRQARQRVAFAGKRAEIVRARSVDAAFFAGEFGKRFDFVFLDADHSYAGCKRDLESWFPNVKPGGFIGGHDYENTAFPKFGVTRAVNEFIAARGLTLELGANFCWFARV